MRLFSPNRVIQRLKYLLNCLFFVFIFFSNRIILLIGCIWVLTSVIVHALSVIITDFEHHGILDDLTGSDGFDYLFVIDTNIIFFFV